MLTATLNLKGSVVPDVNINVEVPCVNENGTNVRSSWVHRLLPLVKVLRAFQTALGACSVGSNDHEGTHPNHYKRDEVAYKVTVQVTVETGCLKPLPILADEFLDTRALRSGEGRFAVGHSDELEPNRSIISYSDNKNKWPK